MQQDIPVIQKIIAILWPSFLTSGAATVLLFTALDPAACLSGSPYADISRIGAYSVGFFCFWILTAFTSALTCYFRKPCASPGDKPSPPDHSR